MLFHRLGLGFSPSTSNPDRRHCYVRAAALEQLLETPGVLEVLAEELGVTPPFTALSIVEQLEAIRRRAIHLAVTDSPFRGLSLEEIVVVTVCGSPRLSHTAWVRELLRPLSNQELYRACEAWLRQRAVAITSGSRVGRPRWPLVSGAELGLGELVVAVAPVSDHRVLGVDLERLASEANFAHEHYLACSPATALAFLSARARATTPLRWDSLVLDRELRTLGLGLLLVERDSVILYLPARYQGGPLAPLTTGKQPHNRA
jgi:hypothetical protein